MVPTTMSRKNKRHSFCDNRFYSLSLTDIANLRLLGLFLIASISFVYPFLIESYKIFSGAPVRIPKKTQNC